MFRRRKGEPEDLDTVEEIDDDSETSDAEQGDAVELASAPAYDRTNGPYDVSEAPSDGVDRLDLGGLRVPGIDGMELRLEVDEQSQTVVAVTVVVADSAVQISAFAAPRTEGIWDEIRGEIAAGVASQHGTVDEHDGSFGPELLAKVSAPGPDGRSVMTALRFAGVDGPRWFVRALFTGAAARDSAAAAPLEEVVRGCIVVRGSDPMAPGDALPLHVPTAVPDGMTRNGGEPDRLLPPERGPEITEIR